MVDQGNEETRKRATISKFQAFSLPGKLVWNLRQEHQNYIIKN